MASKNQSRNRGPFYWIGVIVCLMIAGWFALHFIVVGAIVAFTMLNPSAEEPELEPEPRVDSRQQRIVEQSEWAGDFRPAVEVEPLASEFSAYPVHEITSGETIYSIARKFGVETDELLRLNGITDPNNIPVGTRLRIPPGD